MMPNLPNVDYERDIDQFIVNFVIFLNISNYNFQHNL